MALFERSSGQSEEWAIQISGDKADSAHWQEVFEEHPEFFRRSPDQEQRFALVWRRALPRRFSRPLNRILTEEEFSQITPQEMRYVSRLPISESQVKTLIDVAITLHAKAVEQSRDYRWWISQLVPLMAATFGGILGAFLGTKK